MPDYTPTDDERRVIDLFAERIRSVVPCSGSGVPKRLHRQRKDFHRVAIISLEIALYEARKGHHRS